MRIALVSEHASPLAALGGADAGGQNVHVAALATALGAGGHEVVVHTRRDGPALAERVALAPGVTVHHVDAGPPSVLPKDELLAHMGDFAAGLHRAWSGWRPEVVHAHFWMSGMAALQAARPLGVPMAQTFHALGTVKRRHQGAADTSPAERRSIERWIAGSADAVIATCRDEVRELAAMGISERNIVVVPCGVDIDAFEPLGTIGALRTIEALGTSGTCDVLGAHLAPRTSAAPETSRLPEPSGALGGEGAFWGGGPGTVTATPSPGATKVTGAAGAAGAGDAAGALRQGAWNVTGAHRARRRPFQVLSLGRLVERKGVQEPILALAGLPGARLVVAGGPAREELASDPEHRRLRVIAEEAGVADRVTFVGRVERHLVPALLRSVDVVVCTPWYEPFGIVPVEAMACGVPVVASAVGGMLDTVVPEVTGLLVPPRQPDALRAALARLAGDPELRRRLGDAGRQRARTSYGWDQVADRTLSVYRQMLIAPRATGPAGGVPVGSARGAR